MIMVLHDYKCPVHGFFESREPVCPAGCTDVQLVFLQPVGLKSDTTKHADSTLKELAKDYGMSDIKSTREGEAQPHALLNAQQKQMAENPFSVKWGSPDQAKQYNLNPIRDETVGGLAAIRNSGVTLAKPRPGVVMKDHENLQIKQ
jgi:hypothetical protein